MSLRARVCPLGVEQRPRAEHRFTDGARVAPDLAHDGGALCECRKRACERSRVRRRSELARCGRPRARILLEVATESEWVAQHLEGIGHEVIVADLVPEG